VIEGQVFARDCRPVGGALLDFWHADTGGEYDLEGYRLRGHLFADRQGRYRLITIVPGEYPGRTRHIHVRVQAPEGRILTTQLFFPGEERNRRDGIFHPDLLMRMGERSGRKLGQFHFVLDRG
jgi:protocatechuate 3,4-dioxygenase beta subunit